MNRLTHYAIGIATLALATGRLSCAAEPPPPDWSRDVLDAFFVDARDALEGERPEYGERAANNPSAEAGSPGTPGTNTAFAWSTLIDAETIETEIKRLAQQVADDVGSQTDFTFSGYKKCWRDFSELAVLMAVVAEYDGPVRWQDVAPGMRTAFAAAARMAGPGSEEAYRAALARKTDLTDLVRGNRPQVPSAETPADWSQVASRRALMVRMNTALLERLKPWLASEQEFAKRREDVRHEAQLVAMMAEVISREGYEFWDDEEYGQYARDLRQGASDVAAAGDDARAREALGRMTNACANCHEGYRG